MQGMSSLLILIVFIALMYFMLIRPQNKQRKEMQSMRDNMKPGDEVLTIGGFYGIIYAIDEENVVLEMLPDFHKAMVVKNAISKVITRDESAADTDEDESPAVEEVAEETASEETEETPEYNDSPVEDAQYEEAPADAEVGEDMSEEEKKN